ncbi:DUF5677 domain-containing protein [Saccharothrix xinjiangensis]|uniref:DUF5677 domain-containing protein n=1 Tax=Saccharothrix xinjiangensis TaxID=204798 RepID=A0ABV9XV27_9PSEU
MVEVLKDYPADPAKRPLAESIIRSSFGAEKGASYALDPTLERRHQDWAAAFWRQNWRMSACVLPDAAEEEEADEQPTPAVPGGAETASAGDDTQPGETDALVAPATAEFNRFMDAALDRDLPLDLYAPAKHEVVSGLIARAARSVVAALLAPHLWSGEHGSGITRLLAETEILLAWLEITGSDAYEKYQSYGRGKAKLMHIRMKELLDGFPADPPEYLVKAVEQQARKLDGEWGQEFTEVDLSATFSGTTIRQMAIDTGLKDLYDHVYQTSSAVTHGEWSPIEEYVMQRCMNPTHRWHLVPSPRPAFASEPQLGAY